MLPCHLPDTLQKYSPLTFTVADEGEKPSQTKPSLHNPLAVTSAA